jgi:tetratricopeptide (TPR) repeat protein
MTLCIIELNAIVTRACQFDPHQRYANAEAMLGELEVLQRGQSVQRKRAIERGWAVVSRATKALFVLALSVASILILLRQSSGPAFSGDGPPSIDPDANRACDTALKAVRGDRYDAFRQAYTNFHRAITLDRHFARPYVGLFELRLRENVAVLPPGRTEELRLCASKLKELAPGSAPAYCAQSVLSWYAWNYPQAKEFALRAIKADPKYEQGHTWYGYMLCLWGDPIGSRKQYEISQSLAPAKVTVYRGLTETYYTERRYTNAIAQAKIALEQEPHHWAAYGLLEDVYLAMGDYTNAIDSCYHFRILAGANESEMKQHCDTLLRAYKDGGARGYWEEQWKETADSPDEDFYGKAEIQIHLGNTNAALGWLNRCYEAEAREGLWHEGFLCQLLQDYYWDGLLEDPRFIALLDKIGFTQVMPPRKR